MPNDVDVIEQDEELEGQEGQTEQDEPQTTLPDHAAGEKHQDRQALIDSTLEEGVQEVIIDQLAEKQGDLTLEDLRRIPGAEGMSDDELKSEWAKAVKAAGSTEGQATGQAETFKLPFPVYDAAGNKIDALEKINVRDLFEGKIHLGYNANGKEQRKSLADALRNASMGHWNEQRYNTTLDERNKVATERDDYRKQVDNFNVQQKTWDAALTALTMGNIEPMKKLAEAYKSAITAMPQAAPGMVPADQVRAEQETFAQGQRFINDTIIPAGYDIAQKYGADPKEVLGAIEHLVKRDLQFLTQDKINSIIQWEVPQLLEANGYTVGGKGSATQQQAGQTTNEVEELKKTVAALQSSIAVQKNGKTQSVRDKAKKAPPAGSGTVPGAGDSMPSFKSRSQMKAWMQGDTDWQKA